jgi:hypothetical protein
MSRVFRGDVLIGALGRRRALRGFVGDVPPRVAAGDVLAVLNKGGVIGGSASDHKDLGLPVACEVIGMPLLSGRIPNIGDYRIPAVASLSGVRSPPIVVVCGTAMESGKTLFLSELTQELSMGGLRIAGGKLTGVACLRDLIALEDHGAAKTHSFLDCGHPSTAGMEASELVAAAKAVIAELAKCEPDVMLLELGDGVIGDYGPLQILQDAEIRAATSMLVFCAIDLVGAWGGQRFLSELGIEIDLFSGPVTDNVVGVEYLAKEFGKPAINAYRHPERLGAAVRRHLRLP